MTSIKGVILNIISIILLFVHVHTLNIVQNEDYDASICPLLVVMDVVDLSKKVL